MTLSQSVKQSKSPVTAPELPDNFVEHRTADIACIHIAVGKRLIEPTQAAIDRVAESMKKIGQLNPIQVRKWGADAFRVVTGATRLAAARQLEWPKIKATHISLPSEEGYLLLECEENLARKDLSTAERKLLSKKSSELRKKQIAEFLESQKPHPSKGDEPDEPPPAKHKGGRGRKGGVADEARKRGLSETTARRHRNKPRQNENGEVSPRGGQKKPLHDCPVCEGKGVSPGDVLSLCGRTEVEQFPLPCSCLTMKRRGNPTLYDDLHRIRAKMDLRAATESEPVSDASQPQAPTTVEVSLDSETQEIIEQLANKRGQTFNQVVVAALMWKIDREEAASKAEKPAGHGDDGGAKVVELERLLGAAMSEIGDLEIALREARGDPPDVKLVVVTEKTPALHVGLKWKTVCSWENGKELVTVLDAIAAEESGEPSKPRDTIKAAAKKPTAAEPAAKPAPEPAAEPTAKPDPWAGLDLPADLDRTPANQSALVPANTDTQPGKGAARVLTAAEAAAEKRYLREREMREAVKQAERAVINQWQPAFQTKGVSLDKAKWEARAAAREDVRAQWAREDAESTAAKVALPAHISRMERAEKPKRGVQAKS